MILANGSLCRTVVRATPDRPLDSTAARRPQTTLANEFEVSGVGFVSGADARLRFRPAPVGRGIAFIRTDLPGRPRVPALVHHLLHSDRRTALSLGPAEVEMTEHVLAALAGLGIDNCYVEIDASETPAMDGSSLAFTQGALAAGRVIQDAAVDPIVIRQTVAIEDRGASIQIGPTNEPGLRITYELEYANAGIGFQQVSILVTPESFERDLASARTFVLAEEVRQLQSIGIGLRQTARDLLVFDNEGGLVDNELRYPDECCRHKILDIVGDLALVGRPIVGHVVAKRSGHRHTVALAKAIAAISGS